MKVKKFLDTQRDIEFSAAKFEYSIYLDWEESEKIIELANKRYPQTEKDMEPEIIIKDATGSNELLEYAGKRDFL